MSKRLDVELVRGAIDIHVHSSPSTFHRHDTEAIARHAREVGVRGMILKSHHHPTVDRAYYVGRNVTGVDLFSSITLNFAVGGINPFAVDVALKMGAKCVWMPTIDTVRQKEHYGALGGYGTKQSFEIPACYARAEGIFILNAEGDLKPEVYEVIDLVAKANAILAVGHLTYPETRELVRAAVGRGVVKMIVDHPRLPFCDLSVDQQKELAKAGAILNYTFSEVSSKWWSVSSEDFARHIGEVGVENIVISTDAGQIHNPLPAEGLRVLIQLLLEAGIAPNDIYRMTHDNPEKLVYG